MKEYRYWIRFWALVALVVMFFMTSCTVKFANDRKAEVEMAKVTNICEEKI